MTINLKIKIDGEFKTISAQIRGVDVYIETTLGRSVIQLKEKCELAAIEPYESVIQGMADAYAALKYPQENDGQADGECGQTAEIGE